MRTRKSLARMSGAVYFLLILSGMFSLAYIPEVLFVWDDPALTVANIQSSEFLFRFGIVGGFVCFLAFCVLPLLLFDLLREVDLRLAILMVTLALISVPVTIVNLINYMDVLTLLGEKDYLSAIPADQVHAQVMMLLASFNNSNHLVEIFWGLWLLPFGMLTYRSNFLPRFLGVFLVLGCIGYLGSFLASFLFSIKEVPFYVSLPGTIGEFGICLWLLLFGVSTKKNMGESGSCSS